MKYEYLKKYMLNYNEESNPKRNNFYKIKQSEIETYEKLIKSKFPESLKEFWLEIGYGNLTTPAVHDDDYECSADNIILPPEIVADILINKEESDYILPHGFELLNDGDIPFFEVGDSTSFLVMRPSSNYPDGVWYFDTLVEKSFEKFIWRLYYESPTFYLDME